MGAEAPWPRTAAQVRETSALGAHKVFDGPVLGVSSIADRIRVGPHVIRTDPAPDVHDLATGVEEAPEIPGIGVVHAVVLRHRDEEIPHAVVVPFIREVRAALVDIQAELALRRELSEMAVAVDRVVEVVLVLAATVLDQPAVFELLKAELERLGPTLGEPTLDHLLFIRQATGKVARDV